MSNYWASTKSPVHMFRQGYESPEVEAYLRENHFVDASILALDLGRSSLSTNVIEAYQRKLGLRQIARNGGAA